MDSSDDILANPHNYWRIVASATPTAAAPIAGGARFLPRSRNVTLRRSKRKNKRKTKRRRKRKKKKSKKKHHKKRKWSLKYKRSINCNRPKGFSQRQYCKRIMKKKR